MPRKQRGKRRSRKLRHNPSGRAMATRARGAIGGLSFKAALKTVFATQAGMFAATWAAKRGASEFGATQTEPESWNNMAYIKGALGAVTAGFVANMVRPGMGQKVMEGGLNIMIFKLIQNELVPKSEWAVNAFGQADTGNEIIVDETGAPAMVGRYGEVLPLDESHRMQELPEYSGMGDALAPVGPMGEALVRPGRLGMSADDAYYRAYRQ